MGVRKILEKLRAGASSFISKVEEEAFYRRVFGENWSLIKQALKRGIITEDELRRLVKRRLLTTSTKKKRRRRTRVTVLASQPRRRRKKRAGTGIPEPFTLF